MWQAFGLPENGALTAVHGACTMRRMNDPIEVAAEACDGMAKLAVLMGESVQTVSNWRSRGVPVLRCAQLESVVKRKVCRWHMRPLDWHLIWPELIGTEGAPPVPADRSATNQAA